MFSYSRYLIFFAALVCTGLVMAQSFSPQERAAVRQGLSAGVQFGYLDNDYGNDIKLYTPGVQDVAPQGSRFAFTAALDYNFTSLFGAEVGGLFFSDKGQSQASDPLQMASVNVNTLNVLGLIHLKLDDSLSWVATIKPGIAVMFAQFDYQFSATNTSPPWGSRAPAQASLNKTLFVPTIGISFQHSYDQHWAMNFSYQYYYADYANFSDPYKTPVSSLAFLNVGGSYTF